MFRLRCLVLVIRDVFPKCRFLVWLNGGFRAPEILNVLVVATNLTDLRKWICESVYCAWGDVENRIKKREADLQIDRTNCRRYVVSQVGFLMTASAHVLMQESSPHLAPRRARRWSKFILREHLLKIAVRLVRSVRGIVLHLPRSYPFDGI